MCIEKKWKFRTWKIVRRRIDENAKLPDAGLFAEKIDWQTAVLELGLCHWYTGDKTKAKKLWTRGIRKEKTINEGTKEALIKNMGFD